MAVSTGPLPLWYRPRVTRCPTCGEFTHHPADARSRPISKEEATALVLSGLTLRKGYCSSDCCQNRNVPVWKKSLTEVSDTTDER